jgi:hypothetical protein
MAAASERPSNWATAQLNPDSIFYPYLVYVATPCGGGKEYVNNISADSATIYSGTSPDQYGAASFTLDPTLYLTSTRQAITVFVISKDEDATGQDYDVIAGHYVFTSVSDNSGWLLARKSSADYGCRIMNNNFLPCNPPHTAVAGTVNNLAMPWFARNNFGSRWVHLDINSVPGGTYECTQSFNQMLVPASTTPFVIGSAKCSVQLVIVCTGAWDAVSREQFFLNPWQVFLAPSEIITPEGIISGEVVSDPTVSVAAPTVDLTGEGIASAEAHGTPTVSPQAAPVDLTGEGIASAEAFGTPAVTGPGTQTCTPIGIESAEAFGVPAVSSTGFSLGCLLKVSREGRDAWLIVDVRPDGTPFAESKGAGVDHSFSAHYHAATFSEAESVEAYLRAQELAAFDFTWEDGVTYSCVIESPPQLTKRAGDEWLVEVQLVGRPV